MSLDTGVNSNTYTTH